MNKKLILTGFAIFISLIFLMAPVASASHSISPAATTSSTNYQPDPSLNTNVTWDNFYSGWNPLEFNINATSNGTLNANYSDFYANPVTVNPTEIIAPGSLQNEKIGGEYWNSTGGLITSGNTLQTTDYNATNVTYVPSTVTVNGVTYIKETATVTGTIPPVNVGIGIVIPATDYTSQNLAYDYLTVITSTSAPNGADSTININNGTTTAFLTGNIVTGSNYISISLEQIAKKYGIGLNTTAGAGYAKEIVIYSDLNLPAGVADGTYSTEITGLALTTQPLYLGTNSTGAQATQGTGNIALAKFSPDFRYNSIINNGYTVAVSQYLQNVTQTQTPITSGNYIEQVGYQGSFLLPSAPDLSYGSANLTIGLTVPASQFQVLDVNGVSYLPSLGNKTNGTVALISATNPSTQISYLAYVDYTASQWQSISHPAGIFTYDGIAYYYFIAIGVIAALIGLGVAAKRANTKAKQAEKVDHTVRRGR